MDGERGGEQEEKQEEEEEERTQGERDHTGSAIPKFSISPFIYK